MRVPPTLQVADELVREMADSEKSGLNTTEGVRHPPYIYVRMFIELMRVILYVSFITFQRSTGFLKSF